MATTSPTERAVVRKRFTPPFEQGDHLDQPTFHARYENTPEDFKAELVGGKVYMPTAFKAELIGGVVHMPAALRVPHGRYHSLLMTWLGTYQASTPGTDVLDNATVLLSEDSEPQPVACLRILGGQSHETEDEFLEGPPELVAEVASSSESYDLHDKRAVYERWGVREYLVLVLREKRVVWFENTGQGFVELSSGMDGIVRSAQFPGLWLDANAFFELDGRRVLDVVSQGIGTAEHTAFVNRLATP